MFQTFPIEIVGPSYESRSKPLSAQVCRNLYPESNPTGNALQPFPGEKLFTTSNGKNRGMYEAEWNGYAFYVNGTTLYKVNSAGTQSSIGSIAGGGRCVFVLASFYLYIITGGIVYRTDGDMVTQVTDTDLESPNSAAFLNSQIIYDGDNGRFVSSDPGDGSSVQSLNYATAESNADDLIRVYQFQQQLILFGDLSIEHWYNSGVDNPPFDRSEGGLISVGIAGVYSVTNTDRAVYFLGHDRTVYRLEGYSLNQVSTIAINNQIESYSNVSDCEAYSLKLQGQSIVVFQFPSANKTWAYSETFNTWFELSTGVTGGQHRMSGYCFAFGKHLVADRVSGSIHEWDLNTFDSAGETIIRERVLPPIASNPLGAPGRRITCSRFELILERGQGLTTGQGSEPVVMISASEDGGQTFLPEQSISLGELGQYQYKVEWYGFATGYEITFKVRLSDPVSFSLFSAAVDIEMAGY